MENLYAEGVALPKLGFGTFRMPSDICRPAVESALGLGYRHIDTAEMYGNEDAVGAAIAASGLPRRDLHVTTKVWLENLESSALLRSFDASLKRLRLDFVDLYLIHWPSCDMDMPAVMETLIRLKDEGRTRGIGVANFTLPMLRRVVEEIGAPIVCNQVEYHVFLDQSPLLAWQREKAIPLVAYCPMAQGQVSENAELARIGAKHGASGAQVALKWLLDQKGVAAIPKAQRTMSQQANLNALRLTLDDEDRRIIAALPKDRRLVNPPFAPRWDTVA